MRWKSDFGKVIAANGHNGGEWGARINILLAVFNPQSSKCFLGYFINLKFPLCVVINVVKW